MPEESSSGFKSSPYSGSLNYFGKDKYVHAWLAEKRTKLGAAIFPPFVRLGVVPDTISYVGISLLAGVILYFVRDPVIAVLFLAGHLLCDGFDGAYARHTGKASQSGAFTDLVCDQLGMVVVSIAAIFHHLVTPLVGTVYVSLYLIVVVFGVIINVMGLGTRITITSKYFLYVVYAVWAGWGMNFFSPMMSFFSAVMAVEVVIGYLRLKRGIRRKFDTQVRFAEGDQYSGKLNYALNVAVPLAVLTVIVIGANLIPIRSVVDSPRFHAAWKQGPAIAVPNAAGNILGVAVRDQDFLILAGEEEGTKKIKRFTSEGNDTQDYFAVPDYVAPAFSSLPVDGNVLLLADGSTRLLMGIDLDASFASKRTVTVLTLPLGYLRLTAMAVATWNGKKVWLAANYLYTRKTYVIDPKMALKKGSILAGVIGSYTNGAFPAGITVHEDTVMELNRSPFKAMIYVASLKKMITGSDLLDAGRISFEPPRLEALGPVKLGDDLIMLSQQGQVFRLPFASFLPNPPAGGKQ
ncbi:MAG: CDP-alcohol phosphatidyltransferase family protein [Desulfomonile tiedjei]|nr:CDP-alcohol phosphatidyltransferase family protein [Desulfomonile tiedjei]